MSTFSELVTASASAYPKGVSRRSELIMDEHSHHGYIGQQDDYLSRLRRIEGQVRGLQKMVEDEKYCIDILTQISATTSALQSVALGLLDEHLSHCVVRAAADRWTGVGRQDQRGLQRHRPPRPFLNH